MANYSEAIETARTTIANRHALIPDKDGAVLAALEALAAELSEFRTKAIAEIDELKDQLADARAGD
jgi:hypothetical protein